VLGAPRSGTSAISSTLIKLGVDFGHPENFIDPTLYDHNPNGFFELVWVNRLNDEILSSLGTTWVSPDLLGEDSLTDERIHTFGARIEEQVQAEWPTPCPLIGIKDPRISFLFPIWKSALARLGYEPICIIALRHPLGFVESQRRLSPTWSIERTLFEWVRHSLSALYFARPYDSKIVDYDRLASDPQRVVASISSWLELPPDNIADAAATIDLRLYHHHLGCASIQNKFVNDLYEALSSSDRAETGADSATAFYDALTRLWPLVRSLLCEKDSQVDALGQSVQRLASQLTGLEKTVVEKDEALTAARRNLEDETRRAQAQQRNLEARVTEIGVNLASAQAREACLHQRLAASEGELSKIKGTLGWRLLSIYGRMKYAFLLPIYDSLRGVKRGRDRA